jgi:hypothetical protein
VDDTIALLDEINEEGDFRAAIFLTYGADLVFFEQAVLRPLWGNHCRNVLVLLDNARYADTVRDLGGGPTFVGAHYIPLPIHLGHMQSFHPKLVLLLGHE